MRIAAPLPAILFGILLHLLVAGVASSKVGLSYQQMRPGNCRQGGQQDRSQNEGCEGGGGCGGGVGVGGGQGGNGRNGGMAMCTPKQGASNIAQQAAQDAKKASDTQIPAAVAAAREVKLQLADRAGAAAWAAEAALDGKKQIVEQLSAEVQEATIVFQDEIASVGITQNNLNTAICTLNQANDLLHKLQNAIKVAEETVSTAEAAVCGAQQELQEKNKLVDASQNRVDLLTQQLHCAKMDYEHTKKAAHRASCAAAEARQKALRNRRKVNRVQKQDQLPNPEQENHQALVQAQLLDAEQMHLQPLMQASFQEAQQKHLQPEVEAPFQETNLRQKHPEWEYNQQVKAKFADSEEDDMKAYKEEQVNNLQPELSEGQCQAEATETMGI